MITEIYVPRDALAGFMEAVRGDLLRQGAGLIYGTIRLIEQDDESALPWARRSWACIIFNLHVPHDPEGLAAARRQFTSLIDRGLERGGSYFLTYHRWADRGQVLAAYPRFVEFLQAKRRGLLQPGNRPRRLPENKRRPACASRAKSRQEPAFRPNARSKP